MLLSLVLEVPADESEFASDVLFGLGVLAVEERVHEGVAGAPSVELWTSLGDDQSHIEQAAASFPGHWRWRLVEIDENVVNTWRQHARPSWVDESLVIVPAWVDFSAPNGVRSVRIEPVDTFGLGDHPTTLLSIRALLPLVGRGSRVLDVGCGSGVLSVIAAMSGAAMVEAVDIHPSAVGVTMANAVANGVAGVVRSSLDPLDSFADSFDVVVANILAPALIDLAPELIRLVGANGVLVISGILADRHYHVLAALVPLRVVGTLVSEGWAAVVLRR